MALPIPNYCPVPNMVFDKWLPILSKSELKVLLIAIRKTLGWHKPKDKISVNDFVELTGLDRKSVRSALESLQNYDLMVCESEETNIDARCWSVNFEADPMESIEDSGGGKIPPQHTSVGGGKIPPHINTYKKDNLPSVNTSDDVLPSDDGLPPSADSDKPKNKTAVIGFKPMAQPIREKKASVSCRKDEFELKFLQIYIANDPKTKRKKMPATAFLYEKLPGSATTHYDMWLNDEKYLDFIGQKIKLMADNNPGENGLSLIKQVIPPMNEKWHIEWQSQLGEESQSLSEAEINTCEGVIRDAVAENKTYDQLVEIGWHVEGLKPLLETYFGINSNDKRKNVVLG